MFYVSVVTVVVIESRAHSMLPPHIRVVFVRLPRLYRHYVILMWCGVGYV